VETAVAREGEGIRSGGTRLGGLPGGYFWEHKRPTLGPSDKNRQRGRRSGGGVDNPDAWLATGEK